MKKSTRVTKDKILALKTEDFFVNINHFQNSEFALLANLMIKQWVRIVNNGNPFRPIKIKIKYANLKRA